MNNNSRLPEQLHVAAAEQKRAAVVPLSTYRIQMALLACYVDLFKAYASRENEVSAADTEQPLITAPPAEAPLQSSIRDLHLVNSPEGISTEEASAQTSMADDARARVNQINSDLAA